MRLLVVEDEPSLRPLLVRLLAAAGYQVTEAATGAQGLRLALAEDFDLVVLDLVLPDLPGEDVLRVLLAAKPAAAVIVLSSVTSIGRRVGVLDSGAVDFLAKPFVNAELLARVRLRAHGTGRDGQGAAVYLQIDDSARVDVQRRELMSGTTRIALSQREFSLLTHLLNRKGQVCSRQELLSDVWGIGFDPGTNVVDVYVRRLRAKLAQDVIETVRNVGYRLIAS